MNNVSQPMYSITDVADLLQVHQRTVRRWIKTEELIAHRFGHQWRISEDDLRTFVKLGRQS